MNVDAAVCRLLDIGSARKPSRLLYGTDKRHRQTTAQLAVSVLLTVHRPPPPPMVCPYCGARRR